MHLTSIRTSPISGISGNRDGIFCSIKRGVIKGRKGWLNRVVMDCFVATLLAMTVDLIICGVTRKTGLTYVHRHCERSEANNLLQNIFIFRIIHCLKFGIV